MGGFAAEPWAQPWVWGVAAAMEMDAVMCQQQISVAMGLCVDWGAKGSQQGRALCTGVPYLRVSGTGSAVKG